LHCVAGAAQAIFMVPKIAIIGRPNVGKSSLLNMLARRTISIVDATPGVTRDRVAAWITLPPVPPAHPAREVELIDTGGHGIQDAQNLTREVEEQIALALAEAQVVLFVVDAQSGIIAPDHRVARLLRQTRRMTGAAGWEAESGLVPVVVVANKVDSQAQEPAAAEAVKLGFGEPVLISATTTYNKFALLEALQETLAKLPAEFLDAGPAESAREHRSDVEGEVEAAVAEGDVFDDTFEAEAAGESEGEGEAGGVDLPQHRDRSAGLLLAIVGKRNAGKSTLVNALAGENRVIVSDVPGTTRDSVDVRFQHGGQTFTAIDTAGARKRKSLEGDLEFYGYHRALRSIRRAEVVLLLTDALVPISQVDQQLAQEVQKHFKPVILVVNKWDLVVGRKQEEYGQYLEEQLRGLDFAPIVFTSAKKGEGLAELLAMADNLQQQAHHRVPTAEVVTARKPPAIGGRTARVYYATQVAVRPPTLAVWVNDPQLFDAGYQRYLLNHLRDLLPYSEVPIKLLIRRRRRPRKQESQE